MNRFVLPILLAGTLALGAYPIPSDAKSDKSVSGEEAMKKVDNRPVCENSAVTGTRIRTKRCYRNQAAKDAAREEARQLLEDEQRSRMSGPTDG